MKYSFSVILLLGFMSFTNFNPRIVEANKPNQNVESTDSTNVVKTIKGFLKWYGKNYKKSSGFRLVETDKSGHYFVDQKGCRQFLKHLKSSGFISKEYISNWQKYFIEMDKNFKENPQNEGPPEGFDYDLISGTQEPELFYNPTEKIKFTIIKVEKSKIVIRSSDIWEHQFTLSKSGKKWKIDDIEMIGYPTESTPK